MAIKSKHWNTETWKFTENSDTETTKINMKLCDKIIEFYQSANKDEIHIKQGQSSNYLCKIIKRATDNDVQYTCSCPKNLYHIYTVIRHGIFPSKNIWNPLDLSYKLDLHFFRCFRLEKSSNS